MGVRRAQDARHVHQHVLGGCHDRGAEPVAGLLRGDLQPVLVHVERDDRAALGDQPKRGGLPGPSLTGPSLTGRSLTERRKAATQLEIAQAAAALLAEQGA